MNLWPTPVVAGAMPSSHRWPVTLESGRLRLRPLHYRDAFAWDDVRRRNWAWLEHWEPTSPPEHPSVPLSFRALVREFSKQARDIRALPWVIDIDDGGRRRLIGQLTVSGIALGSARFAQLGYWIDEEFAGLGITPYCVGWAADYCFAALGLHRVEICIRPENAASLRVVEKLQLPEEGLRRGYLHIDHAWRDHRVFVATAVECADGLRSRVAFPRI